MLSSILPVEDATTRRPDPWLLHSLSVNTLNFCSFAKCSVNPTPTDNDQSIFVAVPGHSEGQVDVYSLPGQERVSTIGKPKSIKTGRSKS